MVLKRLAGLFGGSRPGSGFPATDAQGLDSDDPAAFNYGLGDSTGNRGGGAFNFSNPFRNFSGEQALSGFKSLLDVSNAMGDRRQQNYQGGFSSDRGFNPSSIVGGGGGSVKLSPQSTFLAAPTRMAGGGGSAGGGGPSGFDKMLNRGVQLASIYAAFACDMRLKTDVSPLETTEVNDKLADMAFFVKELRECS